MRAAAVLASVLILACQEKPPEVTLLQLERGGSIEFACLCAEDDGSWTVADPSWCDRREGSTTSVAGCRNFALVLQTNRGEIAVVDLDARSLHDSDERAPFTTFPHVGDFPSDLAVSPDHESVYVAHIGEPTLAILSTAAMLGPSLPEPAAVALPAPALSIALDPAGAAAVVTLPSLGALGVVDLSSDPPAVSTLDLTIEETPEEEVEEEPEPDADADADESDADDAFDVEDAPDAEDVPEADEDAAPDVPADVPDDAPPALPHAFTPVEVEVADLGGTPLVLVSGFDGDGGGGILAFDLAEVLAGSEATAALRATLLEGRPISSFDVVTVSPDIGDGAPEGTFLYAADRDDQILYAVDLETGEELTGPGLRTDGIVVDVLAVEIEGDLPEEDDVPEYPLALNGTFVFLATSTGVLEVLDVYDRNCWQFREFGNDFSCAPHVMRGFYSEADSFPRWSGPPVLTDADGGTILYPAVGVPGFADGDYDLADGCHDVDSSPESFESHGITFYPNTPDEGSACPDIRLQRGEIWTIAWEGTIPWTSGIGGNLSADGSVLSDPGLPFCALGVRDGDVLVIEDGPDPIDPGADCSAFPADGGMAYRISTATQYELALETAAQWDVESPVDWLEEGYPLPVEECFPYAVRFHVRSSGSWIVSGSRSGFLHSTALDGEGRCIDAAPPCTDWPGDGTCTLRQGRAYLDDLFVNPYLRFTIETNGAVLAPDPSTILRPGLQYQITSISGFMPFANEVSALPAAVAWLPNLETIYLSDRAWDGLLEIDPWSLFVIHEYN